MEKKRSAAIDAAKAIGIILVAIGHAIMNQENVNKIDLPILLGMINQFHMPLFIAISGYLYSAKYNDHPVKGCIDKFKKYYIPFLKYNLAYLLLHNVFASLHLVDEMNGNGKYGLKEYGVHFVKATLGFREYFSGALWFLRTLMVILIIFTLADFVIDKLFHGKGRICLLGAMSLILYFASMYLPIPDLMDIPATLGYTLTFFMGQLYKCLKLNDKMVRGKYIWIVLGAFITIFAAVNNSYGIGRLPYYIGFPVSMAGILMVVMIAQVSVVKNSRLLGILGKYTMEIMALHFLCFKLVSLLYIKVHHLEIGRLADYPVVIGSGGAWWILYAIVGLALPVFGAYYWRKLLERIKKKVKV